MYAATRSVFARMSSRCWVRNSSSSRLRTNTVTRSRVRPTTLANPRVSRLWRVFGPARRIIAGMSRGRRFRRRARRPAVAGSVAASPSPAHPPPAGSARPIGSIPAGSRIGFGEASAAVPRLPFGEGVADAADRHDERRNGRVVLDLVAEMADVDVDRLLVLVEGLVVAQELEELAPGVDPTGARGEVAQDLELGRGQADPPIATLDAAPLEVDDEVAVADDPPARGVTEVAVRPPEQGLDPAHQLAQPERLRQVVVRAELEPDHLVDLVVARRQHQHRRLRAGCPEPAQDLEPVHAGQPDIEHDEVRRLVGREVEPFLAAL